MTWKSRFTTAKGRRLRIRMIAEPVTENENVIRVIGAAMDITDRRSRDRNEKSRG